MKMVYVVMGETGEYSDRRDWPVCAYVDDEPAAQAHVLRAEEWLRVNNVHQDQEGHLLDYDARQRLANL